MYKVNSKWVIVFTLIKVMSVIYVLGVYEAVVIHWLTCSKGAH